jgi:hypothetical protein
MPMPEARSISSAGENIAPPDGATSESTDNSSDVAPHVPPSPMGAVTYESGGIGGGTSHPVWTGENSHPAIVDTGSDLKPI